MNPMAETIRGLKTQECPKTTLRWAGCGERPFADIGWVRELRFITGFASEVADLMDFDHVIPVRSPNREEGHQ